MNEVLKALSDILEERRDADPKDSYVASLHAKGLNKILEKIGEESTEVILAARDRQEGGDHEALVGEVADLWFHSLVMLSHLGGNVEEVLECLESRFGISGHDEKAARGGSSN